VFRVDRMKDVALVEGKKRDFAIPKTFRIGDYLNRAPWELSARSRSSYGCGSPFRSPAG